VPVRSRYKLPKSVYLRTISELALVKTAWYSVRFRGLVLVGRRSRIHVARGARLKLSKRALLTVGLAPLGSSGANIELQPHSTLQVNGFVQLLRGSRIAVNWRGKLIVNDGTYLNERALIDCDERISIGANCALSRDTTVMDTDSHRIIRPGAAGRSSPVVIGDRCWIGHGAIVLKGVNLGEGCVVAAGAIVASSHEPAQLLIGIPARSAGSVEWSVT
jgi:acetyltransferase-like isoleucine patch superfamily enzyme